MNSKKLLKFSAIMFFAAATVLILTALTQAESRMLYGLLGAGAVIFGIFMSGLSKRAK